MQTSRRAMERRLGKAAYRLTGGNGRTPRKIRLHGFEAAPQAVPVINGEDGPVDNPSGEDESAGRWGEHLLPWCRSEIDAAVPAEPWTFRGIETPCHGGTRSEGPSPPEGRRSTAGQIAGPDRRGRASEQREQEEQ